MADDEIKREFFREEREYEARCEKQAEYDERIRIETDVAESDYQLWLELLEIFKKYNMAEKLKAKESLTSVLTEIKTNKDAIAKRLDISEAEVMSDISHIHSAFNFQYAEYYDFSYHHFCDCYLCGGFEDSESFVEYYKTYCIY